jgi:hypothetical protein
MEIHNTRINEKGEKEILVSLVAKQDGTITHQNWVNFNAYVFDNLLMQNKGRCPHCHTEKELWYFSRELENKRPHIIIVWLDRLFNFFKD